MGERSRVSLHGVDGCRGGWVRVSLHPDAHGEPRSLDCGLHGSFAECLAATGPDPLVDDMPIGLLERARRGGRVCDRMAREALGWPRRNSVFSPPARPALHASSYPEAIRLNGSGMSRQAYNIRRKMLEVDAALTLAGEALAEPKRRAAGRRRRLALLEAALGLRLDPEALRREAGRGLVAADDVLDAAVLTLTARHIHDGTALRVGDGERDARGLEMAIWY